MQRNLSSVTTLLLLVGCICSQAQDVRTDYSVTGRVKTAKGNALEFVTVNLRKMPDSALIKTVTSDSSGLFLFSNITEGQYIITTSRIGYEKSAGTAFTVSTADSIPVNAGTISLNAIGKIMSEVVVSAKKPLIRRKLDKTILTVENSILASGSTAYEVLQIAPGVSTSNDDLITLFGKGVPLIMIDGKPTYLSQDQLTNWLKSMPSDIISEIEIISQPSAKYDAAGVSGIINIKTKHIKSAGFSGVATAAVGYGKGNKYRGSFNLAYKSDKFAVTADYAHSDNSTVRDLEIGRYVNTAQGPVFYDRNGSINDNIKSNTYKGTFTYFINKNNTVGIQLLGYDNDQHPAADYYTGIFSSAGVQDSSLMSKSREKSSFRNFGGNFNFTSKLDTLGREFSFDADYSKFNNSIFRTFSNTLFDKTGGAIGGPDDIRNNFPTLINVVSLKTDLTYPMKHNATAEIGAKSSFVKTDNNATFDSLINSDWKPSLYQNNHFVYKENINAAYINFNKEFKGLSAQAGLRVEQTISDARSLTLDSSTKRNYLGFFPSFFLAKTLKHDVRLGLSYSRRIERPNYESLNPFRFYDDKYTYHEGNPYLKPAYSNSFELNATIKNTYTFSLQYSKTTDVIAEDIQQDVEDSIVRTRSFYRNYQHESNWAATASYSKDLTKWWSTDNSIIVNRAQYIDNESGLDRNLTNVSVSFNVFESFFLSKTISAEVSGHYKTPSLYGFIKADARYKADIGIKKTLWNKKASLRLKVSDVFNTNKFSGHALYGDVNVYIVNHAESRIGFLTFSYNFGNNKIKVKRREGSDGDLKDRIKTESN